MEGFAHLVTITSDSTSVVTTLSVLADRRLTLSQVKRTILRQIAAVVSGQATETFEIVAILDENGDDQLDEFMVKFLEEMGL